LSSVSLQPVFVVVDDAGRLFLHPASDLRRVAKLRVEKDRDCDEDVRNPKPQQSNQVE